MPSPSHAVVHPIVLLSVVDHFNRKSGGSRVVGVLLGEVDSIGQVDVTSCYAGTLTALQVPFDEDSKNPNIWFLDHNYHEEMFAMIRKVNRKEKVVGWYSTGPKIRVPDIEIHNIFRRYTPDPVYVIIDPKSEEVGIPTKAYVTVKETSEDGKESNWTFQHKPSSIGALEVEEVGVEHLLRDVKDASVSTLATDINDQMSSLHSLANHIGEMEDYLERVTKGELPINHQILNMLQDIFNLLPNLNVDSTVRAFAVKSNDSHLVIYLLSMIRSVIALHNLINNKIRNKELELQSSSSLKEKQQEKEALNDLKQKTLNEKKKKN